MSARINKILIAAVCVVSALAVFFRSYWVAWNNDECVYAFKLCKIDLAAEMPPEKVQTAWDVIMSQYNQFGSVNGRSVVHFLTQMFCGIWGQTAFSVCASVLFLMAVGLFLLLTQRPLHRRMGILWALISCCLLYLFPEPFHLWYVPAMSLNYLLTMVTSLLFLLFYQKLIAREHWSKWRVAGVALYAFVAGWMNEAITIPISGALFFWLILHRKQWTAGRIIVAGAFWLGTLVLIVGNLQRASGVFYMASMVWRALHLYVQLKLVWILLICGLVCRWRNKAEFRAFMQENQLYLLMLGCAVFLGCIANTDPRSLMCVELASAILLLKQVDRYGLPEVGRLKWATSVCLTGVALIGVHQAWIARDVKHLHDTTFEMIAEAERTTDGIIQLPDIRFSCLTKPFIFNWMERPEFEWFYSCIALYHMNGRPFHPLGAKDYSALKYPELFFVAENRLPWDVPIFEGEEYYWMREEDIPSDSTLLCEFEPLTFTQSPYWAIKSKVFPNKCPTQEVITLPDTLELNNNRGLMMFRKLDRPIKNISYFSQE
jgi:hypothetical protein